MNTLHNAAKNGNLNRVKALLNQGVPVNSRTVDGLTPLHYAAIKGHLNIVQELLRRGAHLNPRDRIGVTPLYVAALYNNPHIFHALIKAGANPKYRNMYGRDPSTYSRNAVRASSAATKWQNFRKKSIASRRAPKKNLAEAVFSPKRVKSMMNKYGNNGLNKI